jgi:hypothetical protein
LRAANPKTADVDIKQYPSWPSPYPDHNNTNYNTFIKEGI